MNTYLNSTASEDVQKLNELIAGTNVTMMTALDSEGGLQSRPMATVDRIFDGELWFFTHKDSEKTRCVQRSHEVNLSYVCPKDSAYVSVSGDAEIVEDSRTITAFWEPRFKSFFPLGLEDPNLVLLRVRVKSAEYWESPASWVRKLLSFANLVSPDMPYLAIQHERVTVNHAAS